jgi:hypothetical protein
MTLLRSHASATAVLLGGVAGSLLVACVALTIVTRDPWPSNDGCVLASCVVFGAVGLVVARREPGNPVGWILLGAVPLALTQKVAQLYSVLDYRGHHGALPLGAAAVYWDGAFSLLSLLVGLPVVLLFPDGRLSRPWRRVLAVYVLLGVVFMATQFAGQATVDVGRHVPVDLRGDTSSPARSVVTTIGWLLQPLILLFWTSFVVRQVVTWRRSGGDRRQQLKWLMSGGAIALAGSVATVVTSSGSSSTARIGGDVSVVLIAALPVAIGVGILRYRLYEIDRLISRTLSYALLTGLLVGVFAGLVLLTTRVLPFSSPVAVAASTLTAAALFNPLRTRIQRLVDRRFNRARYDAEALVAAFGRELRDAVELETVIDALAAAATRSLEPAHLFVWTPE